MQILDLYSNIKRFKSMNQASEFNVKKHLLSFIAVIFLGTLTLMPEIAVAAPWDSAASQVLSIFTGGLTRTLAIIAVIACGIAAIAGKLSWDWAIKIIVGIVLIFGAATFVDFIISAAT